MGAAQALGFALLGSHVEARAAIGFNLAWGASRQRGQLSAHW
jgi:hypothetical protein